MNKSLIFSPFHLLLLVLAFLISCNGENKSSISENRTAETMPANQEVQSTESPASTPGYRDPFAGMNIEAQLMQVMRRIFEDTKGNLWFVGDDVFCYTGDTLLDFSQYEPFRRTTIRQIKEDQSGNIWFGTHNGIVKYNPSAPTGTGSGSFSRFALDGGMDENDVWSLEVDKEGLVWVGTLAGVSQFNGETFTYFDIPETEIDSTRGVTSTRIVHCIREDSKGNMWFGTNGGAFVYDGASLTHITERDGLCNKVVNDIIEDKEGYIWFATHHLGVCRKKGIAFTHFTAQDGIEGRESWSLYEDRSGNIWFPIEHSGVYRYDLTASKNTGKATFSNFYKEEGLPLGNVHSVLEDSEGMIWLGGFGGLYRYDGKSFTNMTLDGPWGS